MTHRSLLMLASLPLIGGLWTTPAAANGSCPPTSGSAAMVTMNVNRMLSAPENSPGTTFEAGTIPAVSAQMGPCAATTTAANSPSTQLNEVYSSTTPLPKADGNWLQFSDDLDIQLNIGSSAYAPSGAGWLVPFSNQAVAARVAAGTAAAQAIPPSYGNAGKVTFRLKRAIVGQVVLPMREVASLWACVPDDGTCLPAGSPVYRYTLAGTLTMPASCSINAGATIAVDFGSMSTDDFAVSGQIAPQATRHIRIPIQCNGGVQGDASLDVSFTATPATQDARVISTSNPDLGIALGTGSNLRSPATWVAPNTSSLPLRLDGTGAAELVLYAAPVRVGNKPQAGAFNGVAVLKLAIP